MARDRAGLLLVIAVAVVVVATGALLLLRFSPPPAVGPSGPPSIAPAPSAFVGPSSSPVAQPRAASWTVTGRMVTPRNSHTATLLPDGEVLVAGGGTRGASAELYDPGTGSWTATGSMVTPRVLDFSATLLPDGRVLVAGGWATADGPPGVRRAVRPGQRVLDRHREHGHAARGAHRHAAARWQGARGGRLDRQAPRQLAVASAELYDPGTGTWTATGSMGTPRAGSHRHAVARWQGARGGRRRRQSESAGLHRAV